MARTEVALLALLAIAALAIYSLNGQKKQNAEFQTWKVTFQKKYSSSEYNYRLGVWLKNAQNVERHNRRYQAGLQTYSMQMNAFADLAPSEFEAIYLHKKEKLSMTKSCQGPQAPTDNIPAQVNWLKKGAVTEIKNQGSCGACWAFSANGAMQSLNFLKNNKLISFSQQQLLDCSKEYGNNACKGGDMTRAFWYVIDNGITTQDKYRYTTRIERCRYNSTTMKAWQIKDCTHVTPKSEIALKAAVAQNPVSVSVCASDGFQFYSKGIFSGKCCVELNHAVLAIGYGSENGQKYWIVKNSWGTSWGMKGYIWMVQNGDGVGQCGINMDNSFPLA